MGEFKKYPKIENLHKCPEIFAAGECVCTEKLHGSNFRIFIPGGTGHSTEVQFGSRNNVVGIGGDSRWSKPIQWFLDDGRLEHIVPLVGLLFVGEDVTIYGEMFGAGVQKGVTYVTGDEVLFRAFDILVGDRFLDYDEFCEICNAFRIPRVPEVYRGKPTVEALNALLEVNSITAEWNGVTMEHNIAEGVVVRPTKMRKNHRGDWVLAKHKSVGFAESNQGRRGPVAPRTPNPCVAVAEEYVTRGRLLNAVAKLLDAGVALKNDMSDMKVLPSVVSKDAMTDMFSENPYETYEHLDIKALRSAITRQTAIVYRALLDESIGQAAE